MMTTSHQFEENLILLCTMYEIKKVETKKNSCTLFCICCLLKNYERGNTAIRKRHKTLFKDDVNHHYNFTASNELLMTLPYKFVHGLKTGVWQQLPTTWLNKIQRKVKTAQNNSIQMIKLVWVLGTKDVLPGNDVINYYPNMSERYIYEIYMDKSRFYVKHGQISEIIGDEPWMRSEVHCLCNLSSDRILTLTLGSKRKELGENSKLSAKGDSVEPIEFDGDDDSPIVIGDMVTVSNHGTLFPVATVKDINYDEKTARVKWQVSLKTDTVELCHLEKYLVHLSNKRKRKETDILHKEMNKRQDTHHGHHANHCKSPTSSLSKRNKYFSAENNSKLCAEGAVKNLLCVLNFTQEQIEDYWDIVTLPLSVISDSLQQEIPRSVCNSLKQVNSIQKALWVLRTKFEFISTRKLKLSYFVNVEQTVIILQKFQFPLIISVHSKGAVYDHVVVLWKGEIFDYESETVYLLSEDAMRQMCGVNTSFSCISSDYGLFPPKNTRMLSQEITDWGDAAYFDPTSDIRKYFTRK
jgi:hypothetical protein